MDPSFQQNKTFPTYIQDIDKTIMLALNKLDDLANLYNTSKYFKSILDNHNMFKQLKEKFGLVGLTDFSQILRLKHQLYKTYPRYKILNDKKILDFKPGDRVYNSAKCPSYYRKNYVVKSIDLGCGVLQEVDFLGYPKDKYVQIFFDKVKGWVWMDNETKTNKTQNIKYGILSETGHVIKNLDSLFLKYEISIKDKPIKNLMVTVLGACDNFPYGWHLSYVITNIYDNDSLQLMYIGNEIINEEIKKINVSPTDVVHCFSQYYNYITDDGIRLQINFGEYKERYDNIK
jgi:hypothetical protein